jgi:murein DD-endopeptidase MepM/ murein hydrolase activator NlpD
MGINIKKGFFRRFFGRWKHKYKFVVLDEDTYEEKLTFRLSRYNVFFGLGVLSIVLVFITTYIIAYTGLREYIPGYSDTRSKKLLYKTVQRTDSLELAILYKDLYFNNLINILEGKPPLDVDSIVQSQSTASGKNPAAIFSRSVEDSLLRAEFESMDKFSLRQGTESEYSTSTSIAGFLFFTPVKGRITAGFNPAIKHYGIDISGRENEAIKSTLDGTVIISTWTPETGYIIAVQHQFNLISVHKHCSSLLKTSGSFVRAGDPIAIIGNSGEQSTGPHLHFELWYNGIAVNPRDFISF